MSISERSISADAWSGDDLLYFYDGSFFDWSQSKYGFYVDRWFDPAGDGGRGRWHEGEYRPIVWPPGLAQFLRWAGTLDQNDRLPISDHFHLDIGQSGKSTQGGAWGQWIGNNRRLAQNSELQFIANSKEQASKRAYQALTNSLLWNPRGKELATWDNSKIVFHLTNNTAYPIVTNEGSMAGGAPVYRNGDEWWFYKGDKRDTLVGESKATPTRNTSLQVVTSYTPFANDSGPLNKILDEFFKDGEPRPEIIAGARIHPSLKGLPIYLDPESNTTLWWNHEPYPWHLKLEQNGQTFIDLQMHRKGVSKAQALRIWRAEVVQRDDALIARDQWDKMEDADWHPLGPNDRKIPCCAAVDIGIQGDHSGGIARDWDSLSQKFRLRAHKRTQPDDYAGKDRRAAVQDMLEWVWRLHQEQTLLACGYDPDQFEMAAAELEQRGVHMVRFTQNLMRDQADTQYRNLVLNLQLLNYPAPDLREHVLNAIARELGNNAIRIRKPNNARKIDLCIADSMCCEIVRLNKTMFEYLERQGKGTVVPAPRPDPFLAHFRLGRG